MAGDMSSGSLCATDTVSRKIEDLQYTLGEGPCVEAHELNRVVAEPDLSTAPGGRWPAFTPAAIEAGARAVFAFPMRLGAVRIGALDLYRDRPGALSDDQHADGLVMADVAARWVLDVQAGAPAGVLAAELESGGDFHYALHNAAGMLAVQLNVSVTESLVRLRAHAFATGRPLGEIASDVVARRLRLA